MKHWSLSGVSGEMSDISDIARRKWSGALIVSGNRGKPDGMPPQECGLKHVPEKLNDFSNKNMLQPIDLERFPLDRVSPPDRKTL